MLCTDRSHLSLTNSSVVNNSGWLEGGLAIGYIAAAGTSGGCHATVQRLWCEQNVSPPHEVIDGLTYLLTHSLTHLLACLLTHLLTYLPTYFHPRSRCIRTHLLACHLLI